MQGKITLQSVKRLQPGEALYDIDLKGFQVRRQAKATVYAVRRLVGKRNLQITIGEHGAWTPEKARREAGRLLRDLGVGNDPRAAHIGSMTLREASDQFMEHVRQKRAVGTAREYQDHLDHHLLPKFGKLPLDRITTAEVERLHLGLKERKTLANRVVATLSSLYGWAGGKYVPKGFNPCKVERFKENGRERQLEDAEIIRLGEVLKEFEAQGDWSPFALAAIRLYLLTGLRRDSVRTALWSNVDWDNSTVSVHVKRRGLVKVRLNSAAMAVLESLRNDHSDDGNPYIIRGAKPGMPYRNLQDPWNQVRTRAGLEDVRIHDLRHTVGSMVGMTQNVKVVAAVLGNSEAAARRYVHVRGGAAEVEAERVGDKIARLLEEGAP